MKQNILLTSFFVILFGILLTTSFAPFSIFPFAVIALAVLFALWRTASSGRAFLLGFLFGLAFFTSGVYWVYHSIHVIGGVAWYLASLIAGGLIIALALFPACVGFFINKYIPSSTKRLLCGYPAAWIFVEWVRSWLFTGFPWLLIGYSQTNSPLKGYAPILGVYGVSLAVLVTSSLLVMALLEFKKQRYLNGYWSLLAILAIWVLGSLFNLIPWTTPTGQPIKVSLVQGNIPQELKWSPDHLQLSFDRYQQLTDPLWGKSQLIVWPEAAIPVPLQNANGFIDMLDQKAFANHATLILGIPIRAVNNPGYYNAIVTVGMSKSVYLKQRLVPFGEYVPFANLFSNIFNFLDIPVSTLVAGNHSQEPLLMNGVKILPSICYEVAYPDLMYSKDKTLDMLLTVTNDAWFGKSTAQAQHLQMAEMRAIEFRRPALFVGNDGITAVIGPDGNIEASAPPHEIFVLNATVQPMHGLTPWMTNGKSPVIIILFVLFLIAFRSKKTVQNNVSTYPSVNTTNH